MTDKHPAPFDLRAARRAAYAVAIGASCDRSDVAELCRLAEQLAPGREWYIDATFVDSHLEHLERAVEAASAAAPIPALPGEDPVAHLARCALGVYPEVRVALGVVEGGSVVEAARYAAAARAQVAELGRVILEEFGGPNGSEGAVDAAIRIMRDARKAEGIRSELNAARDEELRIARQRESLQLVERAEILATLNEAFRARVIGIAPDNHAAGIADAIRSLVNTAVDIATERAEVLAALDEARRAGLGAVQPVEVEGLAASVRALVDLARDLAARVSREHPAERALDAIAEHLGVTREALVEDPSLARPGRGIAPTRLEKRDADLLHAVEALREANDARFVALEGAVRDIERVIEAVRKRAAQ